MIACPILAGGRHRRIVPGADKRLKRARFCFPGVKSAKKGYNKEFAEDRPIARFRSPAMRIPDEILKLCWFLAGPTACGKSEAGLHLARRVGAEIVALDSMSLYRGMDVGTAKPSAAARAAVPHHVIDILSPDEEFSLADYVAAAAEACREIVGRGGVPLFVGGTGLYLRGLLRGVFEGPPADWEFRRKLEAEAAAAGPAYLHARLAPVDPAAAAVLHPNDSRRLTRALEVYHATGIPLSEQQRQGPLPLESRPGHVYWLHPPRDWLYSRIDARVVDMLAGGLVDEVRELLRAYPRVSRTARQALGYKEVIEHLDGRRDLDETIELIQKRTRQFAKRQHTWFRNLEECTAVTTTGNESPEQVAECILERARARERGS